jgi:hypothetical protein
MQNTNLATTDNNSLRHTKHFDKVKLNLKEPDLIDISEQ